MNRFPQTKRLVNYFINNKLIKRSSGSLDFYKDCVCCNKKNELVKAKTLTGYVKVFDKCCSPKNDFCCCKFTICSNETSTSERNKILKDIDENEKQLDNSFNKFLIGFCVLTIVAYTPLFR